MENMACVCRWESDSGPGMRKHGMNEVKLSVGSNGETFWKLHLRGP